MVWRFYICKIKDLVVDRGGVLVVGIWGDKESFGGVEEFLLEFRV